MDIEIDLGDVKLSINLRIPGVPRHFAHLRVGVPYETTPDDRVINHDAPCWCPTGRPSIAMDLADDHQVPLSVQFTSEMSNPVPTPDGAVTVYSVDNPEVVNLTDNGDGTAVAAAIGVLGQAIVHSDTTVNGGTPVTGDLLINVVAGGAERVQIVAGEPTEVTPDV